MHGTITMARGNGSGGRPGTTVRISIPLGEITEPITGAVPVVRID
jgi:hypothetical protein